MSIFQNNAGSLDPIPTDHAVRRLRALQRGPGPTSGTSAAAPAAQTQPAADGSTPFLDGGQLTTPAPPGDCTSTDVPPGP